MVYSPRASAQLNRRLRHIRGLPVIPRKAATAIVLSPLAWILATIVGGFLISGDAHLFLGVIVMLIGYGAIATPAAIYARRVLTRLGAFLALGLASIVGFIAVQPAWLALFGRATSAVVTVVRAAPGCAGRDTGCNGQVDLTLRTASGTVLPGHLHLLSLGALHVGSILSVVADPLGLMSPALHSSIGSAVTPASFVVVFLAAGSLPLVRAQRIAYRSLLRPRDSSPANQAAPLQSAADSQH